VRPRRLGSIENAAPPVASAAHARAPERCSRSSLRRIGSSATARSDRCRALLLGGDKGSSAAVRATGIDRSVELHGGCRTNRSVNRCIERSWDNTCRGAKYGRSAGLGASIRGHLDTRLPPLMNAAFSHDMRDSLHGYEQSARPCCLSRMQERHGSQSRSTGRLRLVPSGASGEGSSETPARPAGRGFPPSSTTLWLVAPCTTVAGSRALACCGAASQAAACAVKAGRPSEPVRIRVLPSCVRWQTNDAPGPYSVHRADDTQVSPPSDGVQAKVLAHHARDVVSRSERAGDPGVDPSAADIEALHRGAAGRA
jgi:hypothetical protein